MSETFPGIQQDCTDLTHKCQKLAFATSLCGMHAVTGNAELARTMIVVMAGLSAEIAAACETLEHTTDHIGAAP